MPQWPTANMIPKAEHGATAGSRKVFAAALGAESLTMSARKPVPKLNPLPATKPATKPTTRVVGDPRAIATRLGMTKPALYAQVMEAGLARRAAEGGNDWDVDCDGDPKQDWMPPG